MPFLNFNGNIFQDDELLFSAQNRAFRYGEGLIETMLWQGDKVRLLASHLQRLNRGLQLLGLAGISVDELEKEIQKIVAANEIPGQAMIRGQFFPGKQGQADFVIECFAIEQPPADAAGLRIGIARTATKNADILSAFKTTSRLNYSLASQEAAQHGWDDALLTNAYGRIVESTICNVFMIKDNTLFTPPLAEGCIAGIMRRYLLEPGVILTMPVVEKPLEETELQQADELFLTNAVRGIRSVAALGNKQYTTTQAQHLAASISFL